MEGDSGDGTGDGGAEAAGGAAAWGPGSYKCLSKAACTPELEFDPKAPAIVHTFDRDEVVELFEVAMSSAGQTRGRSSSGWVSIISGVGDMLFEHLPGARGSGQNTNIGASPTGGRQPLRLPPKQTRTEVFLRADVHGNGVLSLAQVDQAVMEVFPEFDHKMALMRAYKAADASGDGWINREAFHQLLAHLLYFTERWDRFEEVDVDDDRRVSRVEFRRACSLVQLAVSPADADRAFDEMDPSRLGSLLFESFCSWCARWHAGLGPTFESGCSLSPFEASSSAPSPSCCCATNKLRLKGSVLLWSLVV